MAISQDARDQVEYMNQWGNPATWHGRIMYTAPEQISTLDPRDWPTYVAAIGATLAEVRNNPSAFDDGDEADLYSLLKWAISHCDCH
jgi:hypothetical protein